MDYSRIYKNIKVLSRWFRDKTNSVGEREAEILKPLNRLIDFERQVCIYENNFLY